MQYTPTIGLEIHVQLKTNSKMFCECENNSWKIGVEEIEANSAICPICTGQPGAMPVANQEAIKMVIKAGLALNCQIAENSKFDRKNYFYPDLPKGYQISQYDMPICQHGSLSIGDKKIGITRIHMEEDTARNMHPAGEDYSLVDFNRSGVPLMELVTEPDIHSALEAKEFCQELRSIFRELNISDADMEKSQMRCEVNISLAPSEDAPVETPRRENLEQDQQLIAQATINSPHKENGTSQGQRNSENVPQNTNQKTRKLGVKVEIKNLNSFKAVERSIEYEIQRQTELLDKGEVVNHETRGWAEKQQVTVSQRSKEEAHDYRYFPEPDLPPLYFSKDFVAKIGSELPELPQAKRQRFMDEYGFKSGDAKILVDNQYMADYVENVMSELEDWLNNTEKANISTNQLGQLASNWLINKLSGLLTAKEVDIRDLKITPENFAEFITLIHSGKLNTPNANLVLEKMLATGGDPSNIMKDEGIELIDNASELEPLIDQIIKDNPDQVEQYKAGKVTILKFLIGQLMKLSRGQANPKIAEEVFIEKLKK